MNDIEKIIDIITTVRNKIKDDTDVIWAGYDSPTELQAEIDKNLKELQNGNLAKLDAFKNHFLPAATFQEVSLSNGWGDELIKLAEEYDKLYEKIKKNKSQHTTKAKATKGSML